MITRLRAENFKSWKDTGDLRIAPLTGLFGANSSGKSSILQVLLVLKQTVESGDPEVALILGDEKTLVNLGAFVDVIHNHDKTLPLSISLGASQKLRPRHPRPGIAEETIREDILRLVVFSDSTGMHVAAMNRGWPPVTELQDWTKLEERPTRTMLHAWGGVRGAGWAWEKSLARARYLGPLRERPRRGPYVWGGNRPSDIGADGGEFAQALLAQSPNVELVRNVADSLRRMKLAESFEITPIAPGLKEHEIRLRLGRGGTEVLLSDIGFGISQVLPVLVLCYLAPPTSTLIIEQPELHLHPAAQSELADVLMDVVQDRKVQVILESHSEHLLRRIQRRVAEGRFAASDAALYFCEMENGVSKATALDLTDDGFIKNWPKDFFGDEMADLTAMTEAAARRHLATK